MLGILNGRLALCLWLLGVAGIELCAQEVDVGPPRLTEPSFTQIVNPRGVASVAVRVEGEAPFSYNWYKSKKKEGDVTTVTGEIATYKDNPDGSVNISLIIEDINEEDQGYYWVVVKNDHGEARSIKAELDVNDPPKPKDDGVLIPPGGDGTVFFPVPNWSDDDGNPTGDVDATLPGLDDPNASENALVRVCPDSMIMFSVAVIGAKPFTFQWQKDGVDMPETNNNIFLLKNIIDKDEGGYRVVIKNVAGDLASGIVDLEVIDTPVITKHPADVTVDPGKPVSFEVDSDTENARIQWLKDGLPIRGATHNVLQFTIINQSDEARYTAKVTNECVSNISNAAVLVVNDPPMFVVFPKSTTGNPGESVTFRGLATGTQPISYQWRRDGNNLADEIATSLTLNNISSSDTGKFRIVASNSAGTAISPVAVLGVNHPPRIVVQPIAQTVDPEATITFRVEATGTAPLNYQWRKSGVYIPHETKPQLVLKKVDTDDRGSYSVLVTNVAGSVLSNPGVLKVNDVVPSITRQPEGATVNPGSRITFVVSVKGTKPWAFQWRKDGNIIEDERSTELTIQSVGEKDEGVYSVGISNIAGEVASNPASLFVNNPPVIKVQPEGQEIFPDEEFKIRVVAEGTPPLNYEWYKNGTKISGATSSVFSISSVSESDQAVYWATVSNMAGSATSEAAALGAIDLPPVILQHPENQEVNPGAGVRFYVIASGTAPLLYQWKKDGQLLEDKTDKNLFIDQVKQSDEGDYSVEVSNDTKTTIASDAATLVVRDPPVIIRHPESKTSKLNEQVEFSVEVEGSEPMEFKWIKNGARIPGATANTYTIGSVVESDKAIYWVIVGNGVGQATSSAAFLGVDEPPKIIEEPREQAVNPGESIELHVLATGKKPFDYQWFKNGNLLQSQTQRRLSIHKAIANDEGTYHVTIANTAGTATSKKAWVIIYRPPVFDVQPMDLTLNPNTTAIFSARIHGTQPLKYQWFSNGSPLEGQGIETVYNTVGAMGFQSKVEVLLKLANVQEKNQANYTLKVTNTAGSVESRKAFLDVVDVPPLITQQPNPVKTDPGTRVRFEVTAYGTPPLTYQWYKNGKELGGQTGTSMILEVVSQDNEGQYSVEVSNTVRSVTSNKVGLWVNDPPLILKDLANVSMPPGQTAEFEVLASGTSPLKYTWFFKGLELTGSTGNKVVIPDASLSDAGQYRVKVSNHLGEVLSKNATLKIEGVPKIIKQPADRFSLFAQNVVFSVEAIGAEPLSYQWFFDGQTIPGANKPVLQLVNVQLSDEGIYSVKVSNAVSKALSREAKLIVSGQPVILKQPKNIRTVEGTDALFFAEAGGAEPLNYQWYFTGEKIEGSTRFFHLVEPVKGTDAGEYHVVVTNAKGRAESDKVTLSLIEATSTAPLPVTAIVHPHNGATFEMGEVISFEAIAASAGSNITRLEFLDAEQVIASIGKAPYEFNWEGATLGEHLLRARALDELDQEAISGVIQISVVEPNRLPIVEIIKPTDGAEFITPADILIEASASDADGEIIQVEFFINGYLAGYSFAPPYQMRWRTGLPGEYQITARAKDNQGKSALSLPVDINVLKGYIPPKEGVILWENSEDIIYGTPLDPNQLNASVTGKAGTLVYDPPDGRVLPIGYGQMLSVEFTPADGGEASRVRVSINVEPAPLRVIAENRSKLQGSPNPELTYRIEGFVNGEDESVLLSRPKIDTTAVTDSPIGVYPITVGGAVAENYLVTHAPGQLVVVSSELILEWPTPSSIVHGTPLGPVQLNATANEPGTFDYQPGAGRVLNAGRDQTLTALFTPVDQIRFSAKVIQTAITVEKALPQIHWADPEAITYGAPLRAAQLNATVDVDIPGDLSYSPGPGVVMDAGANQPLTAIFVPHDKNNYTVNSITVYINVLPNLVIKKQPTDKQAFPGQTTGFEVIVAGGDSLAYQWFKEEVLIPGATKSRVPFNNVQYEDEGFYTVQVRQGDRMIESEPARLTVQTPPDIWFYQEIHGAGDAIHSTPAVDHRDWVYYGSLDSHLYAVDENLVPSWHTQVDSPIEGSPAIGNRGRVYVISQQGKLYCFNPETGGVVWDFSPEESWDNLKDDEDFQIDYYRRILSDDFAVISPSPAIGKDNTIYFGWLDGNLYAVNPETGEEKWRFNKNTGPILASPVISSNDVIYFGDLDGRFHAVVDQGDKAKRHGKIYQAGPVGARAAIDGNGNVYFGDLSQDGVLHCLAPDCTLKWKKETFYQLWRSPVIDRDNNAIFASDDQQVWNFDPAKKTLEALLQIPGGSWAQSISPTLARDGSIFLGCTNDSFFALSREGDTLWGFMPLNAEGEPAGITFSSSAILGDGRVFFGTESGILFMVQTGITLDFEAPWPSYGQGLRNTGRSGASLNEIRETLENVNVEQEIPEDKIPLRFLDVTMQVDTGPRLQMQISGAPNQEFVVEWSDNLNVWRVVGGVEQCNAEGIGEYVVEPFDATPGRQRFYRLIKIQ